MRHLFASLIALGVVLGTIPACHVIEDTNDCEKDADCSIGTACNPEGFCESGGPIRIGAMLPLTSDPLKDKGDTGKLALEFAEALFRGELGEDGPPPVLGRGITFVFKDDEGLTSHVEELAGELRDANVAAVLGPSTSPQVFATQPALAAMNMLQIAPFAGARLVGEAQAQAPSERFLFQLSSSVRFGSPNALVTFLGRLESTAKEAGAPDRKTCKQVAVVANDDTTGRDFLETYASLLPLKCMTSVLSVAVPTALRDRAYYESRVTEIDKSKPDCVIYACNPPQMGELVRAYVALKRSQPNSPPPPIPIGGTAAHTASLFASTAAVDGGPNLALGMVGVDVDSSPQRPEVGHLRDLYNRFLALRNRPQVTELPPWFAQWFDGAASVAIALELAGPNASRRELRDAFVKTTMKGATDQVFNPGSIDEAIREARRLRIAKTPNPSINYNGASSDLEFLDFGFVAVPTVIWKVTQTNNTLDFETIRQYKEPEIFVTADECR